MKRRFRLWQKVLLVALLNVVLLLAAFLIVARAQFRFDLSSFLLAPARARMVTTSQLIAGELQNLPRAKWNDVATRYSAAYPTEIFVFDRDGEQLAGKPVDVPPHLLPPRPPERGRGPEHDLPGDHGHGPGGGFRPGFPPPLSFEHTTNPNYYWTAIPVLLHGREMEGPMEARVIWRFDSLWTNSFFFDYKTWLFTVGLIVLVSVICWLPLIRSLTQAISAMTVATGQIAEGHFEVQLPARRRDEIGSLSESINQMSQSLSGYVNGQRRFLSDIAHELCSPIARIQMSLGILEQRATEGLQPYVATIDEEVQHMSSLVNELLSFSKASLGAAAQLESVNVNATVQRAVERERTDGVTIDVRVPESLNVKAQPEFLLRAVSNVLRNAIRYAGKDGPITISAGQDGKWTKISVVDNGPGVDAAELKDILKPFYRPETARQRETGGSGLGLAIVKSCVEACGGTVSCENCVPHGLRVEMRIPSFEVA